VDSGSKIVSWPHFASVNNPAELPQNVLAGAMLVSPADEAELERYFDLRWRVLRAPWQQPPGSERDDREAESIHLMVRSSEGEALAVGRLHLNTPTEAQVRFMAVDPLAQSRGLGSMVLQALEERARKAGARHVVLNARASAQRFYEQHGYRVEGPAERLFGGVDHWRMRKDFAESATHA
jgi:ribosomal protein S18 acetylase RimI-like enzyme